MTQRLLHGLTWNAICPSHYELATCPSISITYLGDGTPTEDPQWFVHVPMDNGEPRMLPYRTLNEAANLIARALIR